jgi:hypothetical protein
MNELTIRIVDEEPCPSCGAKWTNDKGPLDFPNRPKVFDEHGAWWRCYNPACAVSYYNPDTGEEER